MKFLTDLNKFIIKKSEEFGGSGIGLMLTKQIIELHKGNLVVKSELGKGSEFSIFYIEYEVINDSRKGIK